jgi:hypothetical protein
LAHCSGPTKTIFYVCIPVIIGIDLKEEHFVRHCGNEKTLINCSLKVAKNSLYSLSVCNNLLLNREQVDKKDMTSHRRTEQDEQYRAGRAGRAGQSRTGRTGPDNQDRAGRAVQDAEQDRTGRAQVSRIDDLDFGLIASLEFETNQSGSGFI